jgi:hypothetical protein
MVNYEVEFTKELELVNRNQGRHHTQGASAASAAKIDERCKNQCRIEWGPAKQFPMRKN